MKRILSLAFAVSMMFTLTACWSRNSDLQNEEEFVIMSPEEIRTVGQDNYGFIDIPGDWIPFRDLNPTPPVSVVSYSNGSNEQVVYLHNRKDITAEAWSQAVAATNLEEVGDGNVFGSTVEVDGYEAYQLLTVYNDENIVSTQLFFDGEDGTAHYIALESPPDKHSEMLEIVKTFRLKNE